MDLAFLVPPCVPAFLHIAAPLRCNTVLVHLADEHNDGQLRDSADSLLATAFDPAAAGPSRRDTSQYGPLTPSCSPSRLGMFFGCCCS
jgi:hypothetical protein